MKENGVGPLALVRAAPLGDQAFEAIREAIINKTFEPGTRLTEGGIAKVLNISKTPIREALLRLETINLLVRQKDGLYVPFTTLKLLDNAYQLRLALEPYAAAMAAEIASHEDLDRLSMLAKETLVAAEENSNTAFRTHDILFHKLIGKVSGNGLLANQIHNVIDLVDIIRFRQDGINTVSVRCADEHLRVVEHLRNRDAQSAAGELRNHIMAVHSRVRLGLLND